MNNGTKKFKYIVIAMVVVFLIVGLIVFIGHYLPRIYLSSVFPKEELVECYDGKYGYLQLASPKKLVCTLNVYDMSRKDGVSYKQTFHRFFRERDMEDISWGVQSYDLFFNTPEAGPYIFKFDTEREQWVGPLYLNENETAKKRLQGDEESYCFEAGFATNVEEFPEYEFADVVLEKSTIPKSFLESLDFSVARNYD